MFCLALELAVIPEVSFRTSAELVDVSRIECVLYSNAMQRNIEVKIFVTNK